MTPRLFGSAIESNNTTINARGLDGQRRPRLGQLVPSAAALSGHGHGVTGQGNQLSPAGPIHLDCLLIQRTRDRSKESWWSEMKWDVWGLEVCAAGPKRKAKAQKRSWGLLEAEMRTRRLLYVAPTHPSLDIITRTITSIITTTSSRPPSPAPTVAVSSRQRRHRYRPAMELSTNGPRLRRASRRRVLRARFLASHCSSSQRLPCHFEFWPSARAPSIQKTKGSFTRLNRALEG